MPSRGLRVIVGVNQQHATLIGWDEVFREGLHVHTTRHPYCRNQIAARIHAIEATHVLSVDKHTVPERVLRLGIQCVRPFGA